MDLEIFPGDESADMSLYRSKDLVLFLSLFVCCGGVGSTRLSENIARFYLLLYFSLVEKLLNFCSTLINSSILV